MQKQWFVYFTVNVDVRWSSLLCGSGVTVSMCNDARESCIANGAGNSAVLCPPPVAEMSRLCAVTCFVALSLISNHFFFISDKDLSSDPTELTALVTVSHAAFFIFY